MHAVGNFIREHDPSKRILYIPGETFTNELISAIQQGRNIQFRNRFRSVDVLMVDDIQFIAGKESTQEEFFPHLQYPAYRRKADYPHIRPSAAGNCPALRIA